MRHYIEGVRVDCAPSGAVMSCSDWGAVCRWALERVHGFRYEGGRTLTHKIVLEARP